MSRNKNQNRNYATNPFENSTFPYFLNRVYYPIYNKSWTERNPTPRRSFSNDAIDQLVHQTESTYTNHNSNNTYDATAHYLKPSSGPTILREIPAPQSPPFMIQENYHNLRTPTPIIIREQLPIQPSFVEIVKDVQNLGSVRVDPNMYTAHYGPELVSSEYVRDMMGRLGIDNYSTNMETKSYPSSDWYSMRDNDDYDDVDTADEEVRQLTANGLKKAEFSSYEDQWP